MTVILKPDSIVTQMADMERRLRILENTGRVTPAVTRAGWSVNVYKMSVYQQNPQTLTDVSETTIHFDTKDTSLGESAFDALGMYNLSTYTATIPLSGVWTVTARCESIPVNAVNRLQTGLVLLYKNNSLIKLGNHAQIIQGAVNRPASVSSLLSANIQLALNDLMTVTWYQDLGGSGTTNPTAAYVYWDMQLLST